MYLSECCAGRWQLHCQIGLVRANGSSGASFWPFIRECRSCGTSTTSITGTRSCETGRMSCWRGNYGRYSRTLRAQKSAGASTYFAPITGGSRCESSSRRSWGCTPISVSRRSGSTTTWDFSSPRRPSSTGPEKVGAADRSKIFAGKRM